VTVVYEPLVAWSPEERDLPADHARALAATKVVQVQPTAEDRWLLVPDSRVGVVVGEGWQISIKPRLAVPKLMFLLAFSLRPDGWKDLVAEVGDEDDFFEAIASGFAYHSEQALRLGALHGYITLDAREPGVRGRIRFGDQLARLPGLPLPIELSYDEFSPDIAENQMLRAAGELLVRLPRIPPRARARLRWMRGVLEEVEIPTYTRPVEAPPSTRLNEHYSPALGLAELILNASSITAEHGQSAATAFIFDMNEVFESFLYAALREAFRQYAGELRRQWVDHLDEERGLQLKPDITWWRGGRVVAVMDAKYKSLVDRATMPNADAYQMLAYCIGLGLRRGFLVYAKDSGERVRDYVVKRHGYEIRVRSVDVEKEPSDLIAEVDAIAEEVARTRLLAAA